MCTAPFPVSGVTRSRAKKNNVESEQALETSEENFHLAYLFQSPAPTNEILPVAGARVVAGRRALIAMQRDGDFFTASRGGLGGIWRPEI